MARGRLRGAVITLLLAALVLLPAAAHAAVATPVTLSASAQNPNVTIDSSGTAHIAFTGRGTDSKRLFYCRIPAGASNCQPLTEITTPGDSLTIPIALNDGSAIRVVSYRYGLTNGPFSQVLLFTSTDGGNTFDAGVSTGATTGPYDIVQGPGNAVSFMDSASICGSCFQRIPLDGSPVTGQASMSPDGSHPYLGVIGFIDANTPLTVFATGGGDGQFRRYTGTGDINDAANWSPPTDLGTMDWMRLASGPSGLFLIQQESLSDPDMQVRKFDGITFGPRVAITSGTRADAAVEDGLGRLHVVGGKYSPTAQGALFYGSSDGGTAWNSESVDFPGLPQNMRMAMSDDHFGVVVGTYGSGNDSNGVWAARIGPSAAEPSTAKFVGAARVSGTVLIQVPPSNKFVPLKTGDVIPIGAVVDATKGRVRVTIALPDGTLQSSDFFQGIFKVTQAKSGLATMVLAGGNFRACGRAASVVQAAKSKKVIRQLWGAGKGKFQTKGRYAAAAIRGTTWDTIDRCDGTLVKVTQGSVLVTDLKTKRKIVLKKGQSYLAKA